LNEHLEGEVGLRRWSGEDIDIALMQAVDYIFKDGNLVL